MNTVCVPFREGEPYRDLNWAFLRERWETGGFVIYTADNPEDVFSCASARNLAAERAGYWNEALIVDADIYLSLDSVTAALALARKTEGYVAPYTQLHLLNEVVSSSVRAGYEPSVRISDKTYVQSWPCAFAIARSLWDELGGMDADTFTSCDHEDVDFIHRASALVPLQRVEGDAFHLWHPLREGRHL